MKPDEYRKLMGGWPTGVAVVTAYAADRVPVGLTCVSIATLSQDPPILSWCLTKTASTAAGFLAATHFAVNVLAHSQPHYARIFATKGIDRFESVKLNERISQAPVLIGTALSILCRKLDAIDAGASWIMPGHVELAETSPLEPLLLYRGSMSGFQLTS